MPKHAGGRPPKYTKKYVTLVQDYIDQAVDTYVPVDLGNGKTTFRTEVNIPSIEGCALFINVGRDTIYDWEKKYEEFSYIINKLRAQQAKRLMNKGLSGDYNSTISKVILSKHGYREAVEQENTGNLNVNVISYRKSSS